MKKLIALLLCLLPVIVLAEAPANETAPVTVPEFITEQMPLEPQWTAEVRMLTRIRKVKDMNSRDWLGRVPEDAVVNVFWWSEDWCIVEYKGDIGYFPEDRLWAFRQLTDVILPGGTVVEGVAAMTQDVHLEVEGYKGGNDAVAGTLICAQASGFMPMMRKTTTLPEGSFTFEPFVKPEESQPGDALYGFTTFYNDSLGGRLPENRVFNIELAVQRLQGVVIGAGEKFSFNQYCGPYKKSNGYMKAKNVSQDGYGYGGGVCQVSTTIFDAIQGLDHTLDEWQLHSYAGVKYTPRNLDAAVASSRDFSFYNNHDFPLAMESYAQNGVLTVIFRRAAIDVPEAPAQAESPEGAEVLPMTE